MNDDVVVSELQVDPDVFRISQILDGQHMSVVNEVVLVHVLREETGHRVFTGCTEKLPTVVAFEDVVFEGHFLRTE